MTNLIINIHGFFSSPESEKILAFRKSLANYQDVDFISPLLSDNPKFAVAEIEKLIEENQGRYEKVALIGHSLGGYYATYLASRHGLQAILVNPVVRGYDIMCEFFGENINPHTGNKFEITEGDIEYLFTLYLEEIPDHSLFLVMQQLGDEILDPQEALSYYRNCEQRVEQGGCHDFTGFANHTRKIISFLFASEA